MSEFYDDMRDMAGDVLADFAQGTVILRRVVPGMSDPATPWVPPTEDTTTEFTLAATAKRLHQRYENGVLIIETGDMLTISPRAWLVQFEGEPVDPPHQVDLEPLITDTLVIDGVERVITNLTPVPAAGDPVAWKAWCAA
jgi:hypothetical protein